MLVTAWEDEAVESLRSELIEASAIAVDAAAVGVVDGFVVGGEVVGILFSLEEAAVGLPICWYRTRGSYQLVDLV